MKMKDLRIEREQLRKQEYRKFILKAAEDLIVRKGYSAITMDDIAREAQFSKATLYKYFKNKAELIFEIIANCFDEMDVKLQEIVMRDANAKEKLKEATRYFLRFHGEKENISSVLMMDESFLKKIRLFASEGQRLKSEKDRDFFNKIKAKREAILKKACKILREGSRAGEFRRLDIGGTVLMLEAVHQGYCHSKIWIEKKLSLDEETDMILDFILRGIEKKEGRTKGE